MIKEIDNLYVGGSDVHSFEQEIISYDNICSKRLTTSIEH